jgi:predicted nucleotidyltransferase component of viral defense system
MNLSEHDYKRLYNLQDKVLEALIHQLANFYLTGGTAIGRFYLYHRYSDDLDFFTNHNAAFSKQVNIIYQLLQKQFDIDTSRTVQTPEFVRIWLKDEAGLKLEFVNDVEERWGETKMWKHVPVDNPANILANKITAMLSREEPKDIIDILTISENYSFNWPEVYDHAVKKQLMSEPDVVNRIITFPLEWLERIAWINKMPESALFNEKLEIIANDFLLAGENTLGIDKQPITGAKPILIS